MAVSPQKRAFSANTLCLKRWSVCGCTVLYLCHFILAPEAGVVERCVSMLVDCVGVCFALNQLAFAGHKERKLNKKASLLPSDAVNTRSTCNHTMCECVYLSHDVSMSVAGGEMQWGVISAVHHVNTSASHDEHVNNAAPPFPACPVEGAEAMVITNTQDTQRRWKSPLIFKLW